jgi:hypothetical protein
MDTIPLIGSSIDSIAQVIQYRDQILATSDKSLSNAYIASLRIDFLAILPSLHFMFQHSFAQNWFSSYPAIITLRTPSVGFLIVNTRIKNLIRREII